MNQTELNAKAEEAKLAQALEVATAKSAFDAYWAGSASSSVKHHVRRGAVQRIKAGE